jgi:hypothetical protein
VTESERGDRTARNASALATAIAALGVPCALEARGGLVLLLPDAEGIAMLQAVETRRAILSLARQHGFTHVAIEPPSDRRGAGAREGDPDAPLLRD